MNKHTKGPWEFEAEPGYGVFVHDAEGTVAEVMCDQKLIDDRTALANACLIAAAPDLLEALQEIVRNDPYNQSSAGIIARAAIARATGEQP